MIQEYQKILYYLNDNKTKIKKKIMKTCLHDSIIQEIYSAYDGTQYTYICKLCNLTGNHTWRANVVEYRRA